MKLTFWTRLELKDPWYCLLRINLFERCYEDMKMKICLLERIIWDQTQENMNYLFGEWAFALWYVLVEY